MQLVKKLKISRFTIDKRKNKSGKCKYIWRKYADKQTN